jgi:hypothetical protein
MLAVSIGVGSSQQHPQRDLLEVRPIAHVCHGSFYDPSVYQRLPDFAKDSGWRAPQPGKFIHLRSHSLEPYSSRLTNRHDGDMTHWAPCKAGSWSRTEDQARRAHSPHGAPCHQGRIPLCSPAVESVDEVQAAVRFRQRQTALASS